MMMTYNDEHPDFFQQATASFQEEMEDFQLSESDGALPAINVYTSEELRAMDLSELVSHTVRLQQLYTQAESDTKILAWEFKEFQDNFTYFSRAAKLAHKLSASDVDTVANLAVNEIPLYFNCHFAALFFFDPDTKLLELNRSASTTPAVSPLHLENDSEHFLIKMFFHQSVPFIVENPEDNSILVADTDEMLSAYIPKDWAKALGRKAMVFPLHVQQPDKGEPLILGGLIIGDSRRELESKDAEVAILFDDLLSSSLYNARLVQRLNDLTIIDPLTNIYNRRHLINQMASGMVQSRRHGHNLSIAILDIDHFKRINDTYGHIVGDKVLRELADLLKNSIRTDIDIPARYGGEEFVIIMPYINLDNAVAAGERIRGIVMNHPFIFGGLQLEVTCSVGVAEYVIGESLERFIDRADLALYQAKKDGRNRVAAAVTCRG